MLNGKEIHKIEEKNAKRYEKIVLFIKLILGRFKLFLIPKKVNKSSISDK